MRLLKFVLVLIFSSCPLWAGEKPTVQWYNEHYPPTFIQKGPQKGQGFGNKTLAFFIERMPQFDHEMLYATVNRTIAEMQEQDGVCVAGLFRTKEREKIMAFSKPVFHTLPNRLIILKKNIHLIEPYINTHGAIDLPFLMTDSGLIAGIIVDRVYSPRINQIIKENEKLIPRIVMPHPRYGVLLQRGRIDYSMGFSYEAAYQFDVLGEKSSFISVPIEGEPETVRSAIACSKGSVGYEIIASVDAIIEAQQGVPPYHKFYEEWLDDGALEDSRRVVTYTEN